MDRRPSCRSTRSSGWAGSLPAGEALNINCAESSYQESTTAIETTAAADPVGPAVASFTYSDNMTPVGFSARDVPGSSLAAINSDLAFKDNLVIEGHWNGFRIIDASDPANPVQLSNYEQCAHPSGQGDVVVYGNILVRTWDSPANTTHSCGGQLVGTGFEGIHIFDISDPANPVFVRGLRMAGATGANPESAPGLRRPHRDRGAGSRSRQPLPLRRRLERHLHGHGRRPDQDLRPDQRHVRHACAGRAPVP